MIRPIQYLRALAAMMVVWGHSLYVVPGVADRLGAPYFGGSGVDLFFVISGFIMVVTTSRREITPQKFLLLRIVRVVPLYWLATLTWVAYGLVEHSGQSPYAVPAIVRSLLFVPCPAGVWPVLQNGWTLNYEMFFYALFALSLAAPRRVRMPVLAVALAALVGVGRLFGPFANPLAFSYTNPYLLEFVAGMVLAHGWLQGGSRDSLPQSLSLIVFGFYCVGSLHSRFTILGGAFLIIAGSLNPRICAIENRTLLELGNASYSIYLAHQFVLEALAPWWIQAFPHATWASSALFMVLAPLLCALAGCLCYWFIEKPLTSRLRKLVQSSDAIVSSVPGRPERGQTKPGIKDTSAGRPA